MARLSQTLTGSQVAAAPIAFTDALPLSFAGPASDAEYLAARIGRPAFDDRQAHILTDMYAESSPGAGGRERARVAAGSGAGHER